METSLEEVGEFLLLDRVTLGQLAEVSVLATRRSCSRAELSQHTRYVAVELNPLNRKHINILRVYFGGSKDKYTKLL